MNENDLRQTARFLVNQLQFTDPTDIYELMQWVISEARLVVINTTDLDELAERLGKASV